MYIVTQCGHAKWCRTPIDVAWYLSDVFGIRSSTWFIKIVEQVESTPHLVHEDCGLDIRRIW